MFASNIFLIVSIRFSLQRIEICIDIFKNGVFAYLKHEKKNKQKMQEFFAKYIIIIIIIWSFL